MILLLTPEENALLDVISSLGLTAPTVVAYLVDISGGVQVVVQQPIPREEETESIDEVLAMPDEESAEEAEV